MATSSTEVAQTLASATSKWGLNGETKAGLLRVRTGPECPEGNLRELTWDSSPICGRATESGEKKKERERKLPCEKPYPKALRARSQNKGLSKYQRRASWLRTSPSSAGGREAGGRQPEQARGDIGPRVSDRYQTASRLPAANQGFWGFRRVDFRREGRSQTHGTPEAAHALRTREAARLGRGGDRTHSPPGETALAAHLAAWVLGPGKGTKRRPDRVRAFAESPRTWTWAA